jgi:hypothetical protein
MNLKDYKPASYLLNFLNYLKPSADLDLQENLEIATAGELEAALANSPIMDAYTKNEADERFLPVKAAGLIPNVGNTVSAAKGDLTLWVKKNSTGNLAEAGYSFTTARKSFYGYCAAYGSGGAEYRMGSGTSASVIMDNDAGYSSGSMYTGLDNNTPYQFSITCGNN